MRVGGRARPARSRWLCGRSRPRPGLALTTASATNPTDGRNGSYDTWGLLAGIAERTGQLATAEELFRTALATAGPDPEQQYQFTTRLLQVLWARAQEQGDRSSISAGDDSAYRDDDL